MNALDQVGLSPMAATAGELRLFSLYLDFPASVQARWLVGSITQQAGTAWRTTSEMWKLDALKASPNIRRLMTEDAARAEVIIIAASSLAYPEPCLIEWLYALTKEPHSLPGLLIGLLGDENTPAREPEWAAKALGHCVQQTGRDLVWHGLNQNEPGEAARLTGKLVQLLARKRGVATPRRAGQGQAATPPPRPVVRAV